MKPVSAAPPAGDREPTGLFLPLYYFTSLCGILFDSVILGFQFFSIENNSLFVQLGWQIDAMTHRPLSLYSPHHHPHHHRLQLSPWIMYCSLSDVDLMTACPAHRQWHICIGRHLRGFRPPPPGTWRHCPPLPPPGEEVRMPPSLGVGNGGPGGGERGEHRHHAPRGGVRVPREGHLHRLHRPPQPVRPPGGRPHDADTPGEE